MVAAELRWLRLLRLVSNSVILEAKREMGLLLGFGLIWTGSGSLGRGEVLSWSLGFSGKLGFIVGSFCS